jgi:hypothetical protein
MSLPTPPNITLSLPPINIKKNTTFQSKQDNLFDIKYCISRINMNGMIGDNPSKITNKIIDIINQNIISKHKHPEYCYYIYSSDDEILPSPFSHSNYVENMIPYMLDNFLYTDKQKYNISIRFYSNKHFDSFDTEKFPTYTINFSKI